VFIPTTGNSQLAFSTLALGSALALMVYPHAVTGVLSTKRRDIIKRNMALLPLYSIMLGFIALLGYVALADKVTAANVKKANNAQLAVRTCSSTCSPAGSPGSPSAPSSSARWYRPRSWPSRPRTCSPGTSSRSSSSPVPAPSSRRGSRSGSR
jgi:hypothetical protein